MHDRDSERSIHFLGPCRVRQVLFLAQIFTLLTIIAVSLINLSLGGSERLFLPLLFWAAGVLLPAPQNELFRRRSHAPSEV